MHWQWSSPVTHPFNGPLSGTTQVSRYQKGKTNLDFTEARDSEWQWLQLGYMQVCTSLQTDNHASTPPLVFYRPDALPAAQPTASKHWRQHLYYPIMYYYFASAAVAVDSSQYDCINIRFAEQNPQLPDHISQIMDCNFTVRMLYPQYVSTFIHFSPTLGFPLVGDRNLAVGL